MPSSYTTRNRLTKQATGENTNTWGTLLNSGVFDLVDFLSDGITTVASTTTLTTANGSTDQARARILNVTATATITIPAVEKFYIVRSVGTTTLTNGSNSLTIVAGDVAIVFTNGTTIYKVQSNDFAGAKITNIATPTSNFDASTKKYVDDTAFASITTLPGQSGNAGKFLQTNGTSPTWADALSDFVTKTTTYTAVAGDRIAADTTGGAFTITLPASPSTGDEILIVDGGVTPSSTGWAGANLTVARNGNSLGGVAEDMTCRTRGGGFRLTWLGSNWKVTV